MAKYTSDSANKIIKNLQAEVDRILDIEKRYRTYSHGPDETPIVPTEYDFGETRNEVAKLRAEIGKLRHAVNVFNATAILPDDTITIDEALFRMHHLNEDKKRLQEMLAIPEVERERLYGREADIVHRNFDPRKAKAAYTDVCSELMGIQQKINMANMTMEFEA